MQLKKKIGKILSKTIPTKWYRIVANGFIIVPSYYKGIIEDTEKNVGYALENSSQKDMLLLRKYAHIIDKGLHRMDAEPGHSTEYHKLLKLLVEKLSTTSLENDPTFRWAQEKLKSYEELQKQPQTFEPLQTSPTEPAVSFDTLFALIKQRRSNRHFQHTELSDKVIEKLSTTVNWAANSCNKQPIRLFVTADPKQASKCLKCCKGGTGFSDFIPSFWVFTTDSRGFVWPSEMYLPMIDCSLGAQNVFLAAQTLNITGTILSWAQKSNKEETDLRMLLNIPKEYIIVFCAVMGYASHHFLTPERKNIE